MNQFHDVPSDASILTEIIKRPTASVLIGLGIVGVAALGVAHTGGAEAPKNAIAVCTGSQDIPDVGSGQTLEGLIEEYVDTDPKSGLKSDANLNRIARAIPKGGTDGESLYVYQNNSSPAPELIEGETFTIPTQCEVK